MPWPKLAFRAEPAPLAGSRGIAIAFGIWIPWPRRFPDPVPSIAILFILLTGLAFQSFRWFFLLAIPAGFLFTIANRYARLVQLRVRLFGRDFAP
ncbi:MAG: hypothetical protein ACJ71N_00495 [Terriglobales bacterium]|jgi:hypothetical protein